MRGHLEKLGARTAVITGAGSGLGRALATALGGRGWRVGICDINVPGAEETLASVKEAGGSGGVFRCDVRSADEVVSMAGRCFEEFGRVALLVNNAGVAAGGLVGDIPLSEWRKVVDTSLWGAVHGCHAFVPKMKEQGGGHILNVASSAGVACLPEMAPYNVAKAAVIALSETLRSELAPNRIGVTVACPTFFETNLLAGMSYTEEFQIEFAKSAFSNARVTTEDIARKLLGGVDRNRLYVFPQFAARWTWASKRLSPSAHHGAIALMCRMGIARTVVLRMSRRGWV